MMTLTDIMIKKIQNPKINKTQNFYHILCPKSVSSIVMGKKLI